jgi:hypothetical protein
MRMLKVAPTAASPERAIESHTNRSDDWMFPRART